MKQQLFLFIFLYPYLLLGQNVDIPDVNFKNALVNTQCVDTSGNGVGNIDADTNDDSEIQLSEALAVQRLILDNQNISDLKGIEAFENLVSLNCEQNEFIELTIKDKPFLEEILFANSNPQIERIEITGNPLLTSITFEGDDIFFPTTLGNLTYIDCSNNGLLDFRLGGSSDDIDSTVVKLDCSQNEISTIFLFDGRSIDSIDCSHNLIESVYYLEDNQAHYIDFSNNQVSDFFMSDQEILTLNFENNPLVDIKIPIYTTDLTISDFPLLERIRFGSPVAEHIVGQPLTMTFNNLPLLDNFFLTMNDVDLEIYFDNLPLLDGTLKADNSKVDLQNMSQLDISIDAKRVEISNSSEIKMINGENINCDTFYVHDLDEIDHLRFSAGSIADSVLITNMPKLETLIATGNSRLNLNIEDFPELEFLRLKGGLESLNLEELPKLVEMDLSVEIDQLYIDNLPLVQKIEIDTYGLNDLFVNNMAQLNYLDISSTDLNELFLSDLDSLREFKFRSSGAPTQYADVFSFSSLASLERIELMRPLVNSIALVDLPKLRTFISTEGGTSIVYSPVPVDYIFEDLPELDSIILSEMIVDSLSMDNLPLLRTLVYDRNEGITELDIDGLSLEHITIKNEFWLQKLRIANLPRIKTLDIAFHYELIFDNINSLEKLTLTGISSNSVKDGNLEFVNYPNLDSLTIKSFLDTLYLDDLPSLAFLELHNNQLDEIAIEDLPSLNRLLLRSNTPGTFIDFNISLSNLDNLTYIDLNNSRRMTSLDFSELPNLTYLELGGNSNQPLEYLNLKNGNEFLDYFNIVRDVDYICVDSSAEIDSLIAFNSNIANSNFSDYCSFVPGGEFSTISGAVYYDNGSGTCDTPLTSANEVGFSLNANLGNISQQTITFNNADGNYSIESQLIDSNLVLTPRWENDCYGFLPPNYEFSFNSFDQVINLDFCLNPNEIFNDLEIVLVPAEPARPGFKTDYILQYSNKGSSIMSGKVLLDFEDDLMEFFNSIPVVDNQLESQLEWNFSDLQPFENREIFVTMELNSPMDAIPLNDGDFINFATNIDSGLEDKIPEDNQFSLEQEIVNSFDPNDKTCLDGDVIIIEQIDEYIHYLIRFENTGSAEAINIVVRDTIDTAVYDIETLVPLSGSHDYFTQVRFSNVVEFIFENIYLPFDDENNDGYVNFKIKTKEDIELGDELLNTAEIHFDFNFPILTNTASTIVAADIDGDGFSSVEDCNDENPDINPDAEEIPNNGIDEDCDGVDSTTSIHELANSLITIYPIPTFDFINIGVSSDLQFSAKLFDLDGRLITSKKNESIIELSSLTPGIYLLEIRDLNSGQKIIERIVKAN